jgi:hypothetical protein
MPLLPADDNRKGANNQRSSREHHVTSHADHPALLQHADSAGRPGSGLAFRVAVYI